jgi:hypothetical protein
LGFRTLKKEILDTLRRTEFFDALEGLKAMPGRQIVNPLFSFLYHTNPLVRWHAVTAMGVIVSNLADQDLDSSRVIMRRLIWNLNDESGGIGWGSPEAMGDIMANHRRLAADYHRILVSYVLPDGNFLEHPQLQKGLLWGLARLSQIYPDLVKAAGPCLIGFLTSQDPEHRGLAAMVAGHIRERATLQDLKNLAADRSEFDLYWQMTYQRIQVRELAERALEVIV